MVIRPTDNPYHVMRAHRAGATFCLGKGEHRVPRPLRPQAGDTIAGQPGAVLNGSRILRGWKRGPHGWTARGFLPSHPSDHGECLRSAPSCTFNEDVFVNDRRLVRARSGKHVPPGMFYADYKRHTITVGSDPHGKLVEQAVAPSLISSGRNGVTVRNLVIEKAANDAQVAAVDSRRVFPRAGTGWRVVHNDVRLNHGVGVGVGGHGRVQDNLIRRQGQLGISAWGVGAQILRNEIADNGIAGFDPEWEAGGVKAWMTRSAVLEDNYVHDNRGPGLWSDGGCDGTVYRHNLITSNWGAGIQHEISYDALIVRNRIRHNGLRHKGWAWEAGIQIQSSGGRRLIEVRHNIVSGNANGIAVLDSSDRRREVPHPRGPHVVQNVLIHDNVVTMHPGQWSGLFHDWGGHSVFRRGIRFVANHYRLDSRRQKSFGWKDELLTWAQWHRGGHDAGGSLTSSP